MKFLTMNFADGWIFLFHEKLQIRRRDFKLLKKRLTKENILQVRKMSKMKTTKRNVLVTCLHCTLDDSDCKDTDTQFAAAAGVVATMGSLRR